VELIKFPVLVEDEAFKVTLLDPSTVKSKEKMTDYLHRKQKQEELAQQKETARQQGIAEKQAIRLQKLNQYIATQNQWKTERSAPMYERMKLLIIARQVIEKGKEREGKTVYNIVVLVHETKERELLGVPTTTPSCRWVLAKSYSQFSQLVLALQKEIKQKFKVLQSSGKKKQKQKKEDKEGEEGEEKETVVDEATEKAMEEFAKERMKVACECALALVVPTKGGLFTATDSDEFLNVSVGVVGVLVCWCCWCVGLCWVDSGFSHTLFLTHFFPIPRHAKTIYKHC